MLNQSIDRFTRVTDGQTDGR